LSLFVHFIVIIIRLSTKQKVQTPKYKKCKKVSLFSFGRKVNFKTEQDSVEKRNHNSEEFQKRGKVNQKHDTKYRFALEPFFYSVCF